MTTGPRTGSTNHMTDANTTETDDEHRTTTTSNASHGGVACGPVTNLLRTEAGPYHALSGEQKDLLRAYRSANSLVVGRAGSGAGKTGVSVECFGDAVWRDLDAGADLPDGAVFVTFTRTAARDIRDQVEARLQDHVTACERAGNTQDPIYRQWSEVQAWIQERAEIRTLDSLTLDWFGRLASTSTLPSDPSVGDGSQKAVVLEEVQDTLVAAAEDDDALANAMQTLQARYGSGADEAGVAPWVTALDDALQTARKFCRDADWVYQELREGLDACFGGGRPQSQQELRDTVSELSNESLDSFEVNDEWLEYAQQTYDATQRLVDAFSPVLQRFEASYDETTLDRGVFEHADVTYLVTTALDPERSLPAAVDIPHVEAFREQLGMEYRHVIIDEAQDNSFGQVQAIRHLFDAEMTDTEGLYVGDLKQSIYAWRTAEPALFAELIGVDEPADGSLLGVDDVSVVELTNSFRSHPHVLDFVNATFPEVFRDGARGNLGTLEVPYQPLRARRLETNPDDPHIHVVQIPQDRTKRADRVQWEARAMARRLRGAVDEGALPVEVNRAMAAENGDESIDRHTPAEGQEPSMEPATGGQVAFIFRGMTHAEAYASELDTQGFRTAILSGTSLFETPEVQVVEGLLRFVEDLDAQQAVQWLVDSPLTTLDDAAADALETCGFDIDLAVSAVDDAIEAAAGDEVVHPLWENQALPVEQVHRVCEQVAALQGLRESLRTRRHGSKAALLRALVRETGYDSTLLAAENGFQRAANVDRLVDLVAGWEEDEPLSLSDLLANMRRTRESDDNGPEAALTADDYSADTVLLMSAHRSKGQEYDVVVMPDLYSQVSGISMSNEDVLADRTTGMALRPWADGAEPPSRSPPTEFDTFWQADGTDKFDDAGHTWVAEHRVDGGPNAGAFAHDHPFQGVVGDRRAEEFRTLYMALTRACDHLIVGLQGRPHSNYTSWGDTLWDALDMASVPDQGTHVIQGVDADGNPRDVPVGIDDLPVASVRDTASFSALGRWRAGQYRRLTGDATLTSPSTPAAPETETRIRPGTLSPSGASERVADVEAAFRSVCEGVERVSGGTSTDETALPTGIDARTWGDLVHAAVEATADAPFPPEALYADDGRVADVIQSALQTELPSGHDDRHEAARLLRRHVLPTFLDTETYADLLDATPRLAERPTGTVFEGGARPLYTRGWFDLAYPVQDGWRLCDIKTGAPPEASTLDGFAGNPKTAGYGVQLAVYAWLLEREYDIDVSSVRLTYLWPTPVEYELSIDVQAVPPLLGTVVEGQLLETPRDEQEAADAVSSSNVTDADQSEESDA